MGTERLNATEVILVSMEPGAIAPSAPPPGTSVSPTGSALLWPYIRRHWWLPMTIFVLLVVSSAGQIGLAWQFKLVINAVAAHDDRELAVAIGVLLAVAAILPAAQSLMQLCRNTFGGRVARYLRQRVFSHLLQTPVGFHDQRHTGELQSRLADDVGTVERMVSTDLVNVVQQPLLALASFAYLLTLNAWFALAVGALGPALYYLNRLWGPALYDRSRRVRERTAFLSQFAVDTLGGIQAVKALRAEGRLGARYRRSLGDQYTARVGEWNLASLSEAVSQWMSFAPFVIILALGGLWAEQGRLSLGALAASIQLMNNVVAPFGTLATAWRGVQTGRASLDRLLELLRVPVEPAAEMTIAVRDVRRDERARGDAAERAVDCGQGGRGAPHIAFEALAFRYRTGPRVLHDVSFQVRPGTFAALVGPNGGGKSTLVKLLLRFYDPEDGVIKWNGRRLEEIPPSELRAQIVYLPQEPFLIDAPVADNLRLGTPSATDADLDRVLGKVGLPGEEGFRLMAVGERGKRLSGGQRLRLALARALLSDAGLWILDEPSSALDAEAAGALQLTLAELRGSRTVMAISHSPALVEGADVVIRVGGGTAVAEAVPRGDPDGAQARSPG